MSEPLDPPPASPGTVARRRGRLPAVPIGLRPAPSDDELETNILERWQGLGLVLTIFLALFLPAYWLFFEEPRGTHAAVTQREESIERGSKIFGFAIPGSHSFQAECAQCHGTNAQGGVKGRTYIPPGGKEPVPYEAPSLNDVFIRQIVDQKKTPKDAYNFVYETISRGRPGTAMPTWALSYGGPLNDQQIEDVINFLISIQDRSKLPKGTVLAVGAHEGQFSRLLAFAAERR
jgi:mono/diheme cytochrome c family protein